MTNYTKRRTDELYNQVKTLELLVYLALILLLTQFVTFIVEYNSHRTRIVQYAESAIIPLTLNLNCAALF